MMNLNFTLIRSVATSMIVLAASVASRQIEATGGELSVASHIPGITAEARPVTVIDQRDIELSGLRNVRDLLVGRFHTNSFGLHRPLILWYGRSSFLVNGRHFSDSELDLDAIPISAVESIEVLSDSASALHGGQAIGGAVNIVLKRDFEGAEVQIGAYHPTGDGGDTEHLSAIWGGAIGKGHLTVGLDIFRREEILFADRDYSRASWTPGGPFSETSGVSVSGNTVFIPSPFGFIARAIGDCSGSSYTGALTNPYNFPGTGCGFAWAEIAWAWESRDRDSMFLNFDHPLGEDMDLYFDARITQSEAALRYAPPVSSFPFMPSPSLRQQLMADPQIQFLPPVIFADHRFVGHGNRDFIEDHQEYDFTLGVEGQFGNGVGYDAYIRYYLHEVDETAETFINNGALQQALLQGRYDVENPFSTAPEHLAAISETSLELTGDRDELHTTAHVSFDGTAFALKGGDARWAAGAEFAYADWGHVHDYVDEGGEDLGPVGTNVLAERRHSSVFGELSMPLEDNWEVDVLARYDDYSDIGGAFVHKVASRYIPNEVIAFRGSLSGGSRAPSLTLVQAPAPRVPTRPPTRGARAPSRTTLIPEEIISYPSICDPSTLTGRLEDCDEYQVLHVRSGNPELKPDDAESLSLGAVADLGPLSLSADLFWIQLTQVPASLGAQSAIDLEAKGQLPPGVSIARGDGNRITRIEDRWSNLGEADVAGIDLHARSDWETRWGSMAFDARWSHVYEREYRIGDELQSGDYPRNRVHATLSATRDSFTASWNVHAVSAHQNFRRTARYRPWIGHDVTFQWNDPFGLSGVDLTGGVLNIADRGPSTDFTAPAVEGAFETWDSVRGRMVFLSVKVLFEP